MESAAGSDWKAVTRQTDEYFYNSLTGETRGAAGGDGHGGRRQRRTMTRRVTGLSDGMDRLSVEPSGKKDAGSFLAALGDAPTA